MSKQGNKPKKAEPDVRRELNEIEAKALENKEPTTIKKIIEDYKFSIENMRNDIYEINETKRIAIEENQVVSKKLKDDTVETEQSLSELRDQLDTQKLNNDNQIEKLKKEKENYNNILQDRYNEEFAEKKKETENPNANSGSQTLTSVKEKEANYKNMIMELEKQYKENEFSHHDEMIKLEKNFSKQRNNMESINDAKLREIFKNAAKIAEEEVRQKEKALEQENKKLINDLRNREKDLDSIKKESQGILKENKLLKRDISLNDDSLVEYQFLSQKQNERVSKLKEKIEYMKNFISQDKFKATLKIKEVANYTKEIEFIKYQHQSKMTDLEFNIAELKKMLRMKTVELKNIKSLSEIIIKQRQFIEEFFLESLEQTREELKAKTDPQKSQGEENNSKMRGSPEKVDIAELDLVEREKILRILFSKINIGVKPIPWAEEREAEKALGQGNNVVLQESRNRASMNKNDDYD